MLSATVSLLLLLAVLGFTAIRPLGLPEAVACVPAALLSIALGLVSFPAAGRDLRAIGPTVGFLAAVLVLVFLADEQGVFAYLGDVVVAVSERSPRWFLALVFALGAVVTALLGLDATVVLLMPTILVAAKRLGANPLPYAYACNHLANSASILLPISNLTNLLVFPASGLSFAGFAGLMVAPFAAVVGIEYLVFVRFFRFRLTFQPRPRAAARAERPTVALVLLGLTVVGLLAGSAAGVNSAWIAFAGAVAFGLVSLVRARPADRGPLLLTALRATNPLFLAFVVGLDIVVSGVRASRLGNLLADLIPAGSGFVALLLVALLAAGLANLVNNLPAALLLAPLVGPGPGATLAVLLGVNIGPNLSYTGSLATLLWRQLLRDHDHPPVLRDFLLLGIITVPVTLAAGVLLLWAGLAVSGVS